MPVAACWSAACCCKLRFAFDHHVNLRPSRLFPGVATPLAGEPEIDFVVVREGTEGPYTGNGGAMRTGTPHEIATEVSVNTAYGVERVVRDAFARAQARPRKKLTLVHKNNVLVHAGDLWTSIFDKVGAGVPRGHHRLPARRRGDDLPRHPARAVRRDRHRQPLRRHPHRPRRGRHRRHRPRGQRQHRPDRRLPVDVRAGARLGARHRGPGQGRPDRHDPVRRPAAAATSATRREAARIEEAVAADLAERDGTPAHAPTRSATRSPCEWPADPRTGLITAAGSHGTRRLCYAAPGATIDLRAAFMHFIHGPTAR